MFIKRNDTHITDVKFGTNAASQDAANMVLTSFRAAKRH